MKKYLMCCLFLTTPVYAHDIGLALDTGYLTVSDPDGDVENAFQTPVLTLFGRYQLGYFHRISVALTDQTVDFKGTENEIGQDGTGVQIQAQYQRRIDRFDPFDFYAGIGLAYREMDYTNRQSNDGDGFVREKFFDVTRQETAVVLSVEKDWPLEIRDRAFNVGLDIAYYHAIDDGLEGIKCGVFFGYNFGN